MMTVIKKEIGKTFSERVVELALMIPKGRVTTYGHIARAAGGGGQAARSVTAILGKAFHTGATTIPFHRIVYAGGRVWLDDAHRVERVRLYKEEGIVVASSGMVQNFDRIVYTFS